ncbi:hypothetical protein [Micromonospora profundi]|uniref:hypothetical protein n=1 Tax=Micromonospora profundi TaxID=1420889 RepID=UPI00364E7D5D
MIVTVTPTIMSGTVVRWYHDNDDLDRLPGIEPVASASRDGIRVGVYLHDVPAEVMQAAEEVHETLRRDPDADLSHLATHRKRGGLGGPYEPIAAEAADR